jgi:hypothetical protein
MNSLKSAFRNYRSIAGVVLLFLAALTGGIGSARATALGNGQVVYGTIASTSSTAYTFTSTGAYAISIWESAGHSTTTNAEFQLTWPNGTKSGYYSDLNYYSGVVGGVGSLPGTFTVTIYNEESSMTAASYGLEVATLPGTVGIPNGQKGGVLQPYVTESDSVSVGAFDIWTFQGIAGNTYSMTLTKTSGGAGFCPYMEFFSSTGTYLGAGTSCTNVSRGGTAVAGTYYVYVSNDYFGNGTGSYSLELTGTGAGMSSQGNTHGATCLTCAAKQAPVPQSGPVVSNGAAATAPIP